MIKKVTIYTDPKDPFCAEIEKFLSGLDIVLSIYDMRSNPMNAKQLSKLVGYVNIEHFVNSNGNSNGKSGKGKKKVDISNSSRQEILEMMANDIGFLRKPIIVSGRLMTMGYDRRKILDMLQIKIEGNSTELRANSAA